MATKITIRGSKSTLCKINCGPKLQKFAMRWNYIVRQRSRWARRSSGRRHQAERLQTELKDIGVMAADLRKIGAAGIAEVNIPYSKEANDWEARILPWEYVLTAATNSYRDDKPLIVVRRLARGGRAATRTPKTLAIVESAPGPFRDRYDFQAETSSIRTSLSALTSQTITDPTAKQLRRDLASASPDFIHITGIDTKLGRETLGQPTRGRQDGLILAHGSKVTEEVNGIELAEILNAGSPNPLFVGFNCWDSGSRLAPLAIAAGAGASLGFQHTFDDAIAEIFFVNFYRGCVENNWDYLGAFLNAWTAISGYRERIRGSSITLWSAGSLVRSSRYSGFEDLTSRTKTLKQERSQRIKTLRDADPSSDDVTDYVQVSVTPKMRLNYSLLHNGGSLFDEFVIRFQPKTDEVQPDASDDTSEAGPEVGLVDDIDVDVQLHVGTESFPYRTKLSVGVREERYDLASTDTKFRPRISGNPVGGIRLPLTSDLIRSVSERIQTSMFVQVRWHDQVIYRHTHPVWLSPIDEWSLNDDEIVWLPSFVQPRDPAVASAVAAAQKYLKCLADYGGAGFDGYQSYDEDARGIDQWQGIDQQVQAIWSALSFDSNIHYINPPPSYAESSQRLRTPTEIFQQGRGTCVDLAILLASCLEWVEIYPVVFMLDDHAFPGYWKSMDAYDQFLNVELEDDADVVLESDGRDSPTSPRWIFDRESYVEIQSYVQSGELVPIESVDLTGGYGFSEAIADASVYFEAKRNRKFHSMVDIVSAREGNGVTPLPIRYRNHGTREARDA